MSEAAREDIIAEVEGCAGRLRLNRPRALNALTLDMVRAMTAALVAWRDDLSVEAVLLDHATERGFCAGGDVVALARSTQGHGAAARAFFFQEYRLNHLIFNYPKPMVAFMDGVTMGGGVGLARPCCYRVATERTLMAMPETSIGFFPDVGGGWHLSRLLGRLPQFVALTGARLDGAECFALGLATHYLPSEALGAAKRAIAHDPGRIDAILADAAVAPPPARIKTNREKIDRLFASDRFEDILATLEADGSDWAAKELKTLRSKSPTACKVSLRLLREGATRQDFAGEMTLEYALTVHVTKRHDFAEGVRAMLIDRDNTPHWQPAHAEGVSEAELDALFAPLPPREAWTPLEDAA